MKILPLILPAVLLVSCGADKRVADGLGTSSSAERKAMRERFAPGVDKPDDKGNYGGSVRKQFNLGTDRKSPYFNSASSMPQKYQAGDFAKNGWKGKTAYPKQAYTGNTDGSRFQTPARAQGVDASEAGTLARIPGTYATGDFTTGKAREARQGAVRTPEANETAGGRGNLPEPEVIGWQQMRQLNMEETRGILGR